jgi:malate/lactate dehydrogenase
MFLYSEDFSPLFREKYINVVAIIYLKGNLSSGGFSMSGIDDVVLGVIGLGGAASFGKTCAVSAVSRCIDSIGNIHLKGRNDGASSDPDSESREAFVKNAHIPDDLSGVVVIHEKDATARIAEECNVIALCFDTASFVEGGLRVFPPEGRRAFFNANIDAMVDYGKAFGELRSEATFIVCTSHVDLLTHYFYEAYWRARNMSPKPGKIVGLNHVDSLRLRKRLKTHLMERGLEFVDIYSPVWGPHDERAFVMPSLVSGEREGQRMPILSEKDGSGRPLIDVETIEKMLRDSKRYALRGLEKMGSTSDETAEALVEVINAIHRGGEVVHLSYPVPEEFAPGRRVFMGLPVFFDSGRAFPVNEKIREALEVPAQRKVFSSVVESCQSDIAYLDSRQKQVAAHIKSTGKSPTIADNPKFFKELVIPKKKDGESWLHFHNFTYPFDDRSEVRPPIRVAGDAAVYIDNVVKGGESQLAVSHTTGVQIVNPRTGRSEDYSLPRTVVAGRKHCNGCCTIDDVVSHERDVVIASVNGEGLLRGRIAGAGSDGSETGTLDQVGGVPDRFKGYVRAHKGRTYYLAGTGVVEAELRSGSIVPLREYSVDCPDLRGAELNNFAIFDTAPPTKADVRDMRVFVSATRPDKYDYLGGVFESVGGKGREVYSVSEASRRARPDVRLVSVEHIFGKYHLAVGSSDKVVLIDMEDPLIKIPVCLSRGNVQSFVVADLFDELDVFAAKNRSTSSPTSYFYRAKFDRKGGKLSLEHCGDGLLDPEESFPFLINHACVYSEFMG